MEQIPLYSKKKPRFSEASNFYPDINFVFLSFRHGRCSDR